MRDYGRVSPPAASYVPRLKCELLMTDVEASLPELPAAIAQLRASDSLTIRGGGVLERASLTNIAASDIQIVPTESPASTIRAALPAKWFTRVGRDIPVFRDCDFSGVHGWFEPGIARFYRCRFSDAQVRGQLMQAHFVECIFSGTWDANFTTEAAPQDPASRAVVSGNDFRALRGMDFFGVPRGVNLLDTGGIHLVLTREHLANAVVAGMLAATPSGQRLIERLERGTDDWVLVEEGTSMAAPEWRALRAATLVS
jgi:hypothetical protein